MRNLTVAALAASLLSFGVAGAASAAPLDFSGTLSVQIGTLAPISVNASGTASDFTDIKNFTLDGGTFSLVTTVVITDPAVSGTIPSLRANAVNGAGTFVNGGGAMPILGGVQVCLFAPGCLPGLALNVPLSLDANNAVGVGGTVSAQGPVSVTLAQLGPWSTGVVSVTNPFAAGTPLDPTTINATGTMSGNMVTLVTPLAIFTSLTAAFPFLSGFATLKLTFVPEPGTLLLLGAGVAGLGLFGRRRA